MNNLVQAYIDFLIEFKPVEKPIMPKFNVSEYTDNEYQIAINEIMCDYQFVEDLDCSLKFFKGEWWKLSVAKFIMQI